MTLRSPFAIRISIHAPRTGSDISICSTACGCDISIHAPRTGSDPICAYFLLRTNNFNPRSPHGERQEAQRPCCARADISIHAPRTGSDGLKASLCEGVSGYFNPRSPHGERLDDPFDMVEQIEISIHAPRTGSDVLEQTREIKVTAFQSTLPARGATSSARCLRSGTLHFNPRSPHGERLHRPHNFVHVLRISIHAPRTGSDYADGVFQSLPDISIHAPRTGSDYCNGYG